VPEEDVVGKQVVSVCNRAEGVLEKDVVVKQVGAGCNRAVGVPEGDLFGKQNGAVRKGIRRWPEENQFKT
jgi:hypothetical protein